MDVPSTYLDGSQPVVGQGEAVRSMFVTRGFRGVPLRDDHSV